MEKQKNLKALIIGGVAATAVAAGVAAFTLMPDVVSAQAVQAPDTQGEQAGFRGRIGERGAERGFGERGIGDRGEKGAEHSQHLADALGISADELDAAQAAVAQAAIAQAIEDGLITQDQADRMARRAGNFGGPRPMMGRHGRGGFGSGIDHEAQLADELGISVDELQAAQEEARQAGIDQAVADGYLTAEEADLMQAGHALRAYIDHEAIMEEVLGLSMDELKAAREEGVSIRDLLAEQGLDRDAIHEAMQSAHEEAVAQAVEEGVITQAQADALSDGEGFGGHGGIFPGRGGHGGRGGHDMGPGGFRPHEDSERGNRFEGGNGESAAPNVTAQSPRA
jgi:ribosomal protein L19E/biotin operon repressor